MDNKDLESIGNLSLPLLTIHGQPRPTLTNDEKGALSKDKANLSTEETVRARTQTEPLYFAFNPTNRNVTARYKFPGDSNSTPLNQYDATSAQTLHRLPADVNMILVEITWTDGSGPKGICLPAPPIKCPCDPQGKPLQTTPPANKPATGNQPPDADPCCIIDAIFLRGFTDENGNMIPAVVLSRYRMLVSEALIRKIHDKQYSDSFPSFVIDGFPLSEYFPQKATDDPVEADYTDLGGWASGDYYCFQAFPPSDSCRPYTEKQKAVCTARPQATRINRKWRDNGIRPDPVKVFDVFTLRQMLAATATQLAGVSGFSAASITSAFGNIQGITSDVSYLSAQATTVATPTVSSVLSNGNSLSNTLGGTAGQTGSLSSSGSTITCPPGTLPGVGSSGNPACVLVTSSVNLQNSSGSGGTAGTTANTQSTVNTAGAGNVNGGSSNLGGFTASNGFNSSASLNNVQGANQNSTVTTNSGGQAGTISSVPVSNAFSAPTNVGVSSQDILAEQVQLNSQITNLRLALQGALSDQYLVRGGKTISSRQQTTLGLNITLDPVERYRHAAAEVRIWVYPARTDDSMSIVNLLPAAKTYNVAKITSSQKAFGAGVVVDAVNVGAATGRSKNRLYLAKDTDTVALEYFPNSNKEQQHPWSDYGAELVGRSAQEHAFDVARVMELWQEIDPCTDDPGPDLEKSAVGRSAIPLVFGWQFRPVLGADFVQSGQRQVFAQLALPVGTGDRWMPLVFVQTRWREYDSKKQVMGATYKDSCSIKQDTNPVLVNSPLKVHTVNVDDMGGGIVKVSAEGEFFQQGFSVMSGPTTLGPATFDGEHIQFFANAATLLTTDDLKLVAENGQTADLGVKPIKNAQACGIVSAHLTAVPRPDGNSWVEATITTGPAFKKNPDVDPNPLFLAGGQVFGLHETPFLKDAPNSCQIAAAGGLTCTYRFLASTSALRSAQTFTARDLSWIGFKSTQKINFDPSFGSLVAMTSDSSSAGDGSSSSKSPTLFTLTGTDLLNLPGPANWSCGGNGCLEVFEGMSPIQLGIDNFQVPSATTAVIALGPKTAIPEISFTGNKITIRASGAGAKKNPPVPLAYPAAPPLPAHANPPKDPTQFFYTIGGAAPVVGPAATLYSDATGIPTGGFAVGANIIVKAMATAPNQMPSPVAEARFYKTAANNLVPQYVLNASSGSYKFYRFLWHSTIGVPVEWDLSIPIDAAKSGVIASTILNVSDSTEVEFSGVNVLPDSPNSRISFLYNDQLVPNALFSYDAIKKVLKLMITSDMTAKPGHKEIVLNGFLQDTDGTSKTTQILLPFDVTKR